MCWGKHRAGSRKERWYVLWLSYPGQREQGGPQPPQSRAPLSLHLPPPPGWCSHCPSLPLLLCSGLRLSLPRCRPSPALPCVHPRAVPPSTGRSRSRPCLHHCARGPGYKDVVIHEAFAQVAHDGILRDLGQQHHVVHAALLHVVALPVEALLAALGGGVARWE